MKSLVRHTKHTFRNFCILLCTILGISRFYRARTRKHGQLVRIIVFHDITHRRWFDLVVEEIVNTFHVITPEAFHRGEFHPEKINVLFTFDDGYDSWVTTALPVLEENCIKAIFFANSGLLDVAHDEEKADRFMKERLMITPRPPLTWEGLLKLSHKGHTIGGHTCTHANLAQVSPEILMSEILDDKHALEEHLDTTLIDFAYPFGTLAHVTGAARTQARNAGYVHGYTATTGFVKERATFSIPRMCIEETLTPRGVKRWIQGGYDVFDYIKHLCA